MACVALAAAAQAWAQQARPPQEVYTCIDKHGRRITSDRPIAECLDREQRELNPSGSERRRIPPVLSENERAALEQRLAAPLAPADIAEAFWRLHETRDTHSTMFGGVVPSSRGTPRG